MLDAEYETLPRPMGDAIVRFFDANQVWLGQVLEDGQAAGTLSFEGDPGDAAQSILAGLEGAMLIARPYGDPARFDSAARRVLASFAKGFRRRLGQAPALGVTRRRASYPAEAVPDRALTRSERLRADLARKRRDRRATPART